MADKVEVFVVKGPALLPAMKLDTYDGVIAYLVAAAKVTSVKLLSSEIRIQENAEVHFLREYKGRLYWTNVKVEDPPTKVVDQIHVYHVEPSEDDPRTKRPRVGGQDIRLFWNELDKAIKDTYVVDLRPEIVTAAVRVAAVTMAAESSSGIQVHRRRNRRLGVEATRLNLVPETFFPNTQMSQIMIRDVYDKFADIAFGILRGERYSDARKVRHFFVTGTPGTGKTIFGFYMLYKLRMDPVFKDAVIIWEEGSEHGPCTSFYFRGNEMRLGKVGAFDDDVTEGTIFLVNGPQPVLRMRQNVGHVIMFSSTEDVTGSTWQFCKDTQIHIVYMPLWDLCELLLAAGMSNGSFSEDSVRERFEKFGGSARSVLLQYSNMAYMTRFETALQQAKDKAGLQYTVGSLLQAKESSSFILHLKVVDEDCMKTSVVFASHYVQMELKKYERMDDLVSAVEYVNKSSLVPDEGIIAGNIFEFLVHKLFDSSIIGTLKFKAKQLSPEIDKTEKVTFQLSGKLQQFHNLNDINAVSYGYFVPDYKTYPVYDSLVLMKDPSKGVKAQALQITINTFCPAKLEFVEELKERWELARFYYVVPEHLFDKFPYQKLMHGKSECIWPCELWKLAIPDDFFSFYKS